MDLRQRFIEDNEFDIDINFASKISKFQENVVEHICADITSIIDKLPTKVYFSQDVCGVVKDGETFYTLEYLNEDDSVLIMIDLNVISLDEYLDAIIAKKTIKYYQDL